MFNLGVTELVLLFLIIIVLFGATRIPQIGEGLGKGIRNFRRALKGDDATDVSPPKEITNSGKKDPHRTDS